MKRAINELHPAIQFTMETGNKKTENMEWLNFLDIEVILRDGVQLRTDLLDPILPLNRKIIAE